MVGEDRFLIGEVLQNTKFNHPGEVCGSFSWGKIALGRLFVPYKNGCSLITKSYYKVMELRHLRYFVAVAEELNFSRAAQRLHIAQPALSNQIKSLEGELGVQLLERTRRVVRLTEAGKTLLSDARPLLADARTAEMHARGAQKGETGTLHIGYVLSTANARLASIIKAFRRDFPGVNPDLAQLPTGAQIAGLRNRQLDVGFVRPPVSSPEIQVEVIGEEKMVLAVAASDPLARKKRLTWDDLNGKMVLSVHPTVANYYYESFFALCRRHKVKLTVGPLLAGYSQQPLARFDRIRSDAHLGFGPRIRLLQSRFLQPARRWSRHPNVAGLA